MGKGLSISERQIGEVTILDLDGRMVLEDGVLPFRAAVQKLIDGGRPRVLVNLERVPYIDSAGVGMLVAKYLSVRRRGGDMKLLHLTLRTHRVMSITRLLTVFEAFESERDALKSFERGPASA